MNNQETIDGLLESLDNAIEKRDKSFERIDNQYKRENGHVLSSQYDEYQCRKEYVIARFNSDALDYQNKLNNLCNKVRKKQPVLIELDNSKINTKWRFPRRIALGKLRVRYENLNFYVPQMFKFPFEKPMYICGDEQVVQIHKILLRLLYALPINKQEYYVFDPDGLGKILWNFNSLFSNEKLFPQKKIMSNSRELKEALKDVMQYIESLYSSAFNLETECYDWDTYNRRVYSQKNIRKMLPYKVFIFTNVPNGMDSECFDMFKKILLHSKECGFLILFSFNELLLQAEDSKIKSMELELKKCIDNSIPLHAVINRKMSEKTFSRLSVTSVGEKFPDDVTLMRMLSEINHEITNNSSSMFSFDELLDQKNIFTDNSATGLDIPIGYTSSGSGKVELNIGDRIPHYLIGGTTGSGKSNFLHNLIMNACWKYSPEELRVYLLDFKEGVEFSRYADPVLPHAELVATEADTEYGITVLRHLVKEQDRRFSIFKQIKNCNDIKTYRQMEKVERMPRILVVIDEFQVLFANSHKDKTIETLAMIAKQGRACGIHLVLATQSLKGIDFGNLAPQFGGRVALKCSQEDSKILLGGITSNNEEASELEIPYAIMNVSQGSKSGNIKFAVPEAKGEEITRKIDDIKGECARERIVTNTKIFEGQKFPEYPKCEMFKSNDTLVLTLGRIMDYDGELFKISLKNSMENNILICGRDDEMKKNFIKAIYISAVQSNECDELIYVGDNSISFEENIGKCKFVSYIDIKDFIDNYKDNYFDTKKILIIDNCNLTKEIGFPPPQFGTPNQLGVSFKTFWDQANKSGSHIIAFYDGANRIKSSGLPIADFCHRIGFALNTNERNYFLENTMISSSKTEKKRAFYANNLELEAWFRPFM